jgi:outer membrane protein assembly factor BamB
VVVANYMNIALSDGDTGVQYSPNGKLLNVDDRKALTGHAILYVLDAQTGKTLYSSADLIKGFSHFSGFVVAGGRVYIGTQDGTLYAFGLGQPF